MCPQMTGPKPEEGLYGESHTHTLCDKKSIRVSDGSRPVPRDGVPSVCVGPPCPTLLTTLFSCGWIGLLSAPLRRTWSATSPLGRLPSDSYVWLETPCRRGSPGDRVHEPGTSLGGEESRLGWWSLSCVGEFRRPLCCQKFFSLFTNVKPGLKTLPVSSVCKRTSGASQTSRGDSKYRKEN